MNIGETVSTLLIDIGSSHLVVEYLAAPGTPPLTLVGRRFAPDSPVRCTLRGDPLISLRMLLSHGEVLPPLRRTRIVLGVGRDPLFPALSALPQTLKVLELLAEERPHSLLIQTRSPLVLLTLPLLRRFERSEYRIAIEAFDDKIAKVFFPRLPRPSERLEAARTLRRLGCAASVQIAPALLRANPRSQLAPIVDTLRSLDLPVHVLSLDRLVPQFSSEAAGSAQALLRSLRRLHPEGHRFLSHELDCGSPRRPYDPQEVLPSRARA